MSNRTAFLVVPSSLDADSESGALERLNAAMAALDASPVFERIELPGGSDLFAAQVNYADLEDMFRLIRAQLWREPSELRVAVYSNLRPGWDWTVFDQEPRRAEGENT